MASRDASIKKYFSQQLAGILSTAQQIPGVSGQQYALDYKKSKLYKSRQDDSYRIESKSNYNDENASIGSNIESISSAEPSTTFGNDENAKPSMVQFSGGISSRFNEHVVYGLGQTLCSLKVIEAELLLRLSQIQQARDSLSRELSLKNTLLKESEKRIHHLESSQYPMLKSALGAFKEYVEEKAEHLNIKPVRDPNESSSESDNDAKSVISHSTVSYTNSDDEDNNDDNEARHKNRKNKRKDKKMKLNERNTSFKDEIIFQKVWENTFSNVFGCINTDAMKKMRSIVSQLESGRMRSLHIKILALKNEIERKLHDEQSSSQLARKMLKKSNLLIKTLVNCVLNVTNTNLSCPEMPGDLLSNKKSKERTVVSRDNKRRQRLFDRIMKVVQKYHSKKALEQVRLDNVAFEEDENDSSSMSDYEKPVVNQVRSMPKVNQAYIDRRNVKSNNLERFNGMMNRSQHRRSSVSSTGRSNGKYSRRSISVPPESKKKLSNGSNSKMKNTTDRYKSTDTKEKEMNFNNDQQKTVRWDNEEIR